MKKTFFIFCVLIFALIIISGCGGGSSSGGGGGTGTPADNTPAAPLEQQQQPPQQQQPQQKKPGWHIEQRAGEEPVTYYKLWVSDANTFNAAGDKGLSQFNKGTGWSNQQIINNMSTMTITDVLRASNNNLYFTGFQPETLYGGTGFVWQYDGSSWKALLSEYTFDPKGIWEASDGKLYAAGPARDSGVIGCYDGISWKYTYGDNFYFYFNGIWGASADNIFVAGNNAAKNTGFIFHYDGNKWEGMHTYPALLKKISGLSANNVFAVGSSGTILHYDGASWTQMDSGVNANLNNLWCASPDNVYAVGDSGTILRYDGASWTKMDSGTSANLYSILGTSPVDLFATGQNGVILHYY